jgi:hypothetical protein
MNPCTHHSEAMHLGIHCECGSTQEEEHPGTTISRGLLWKRHSTYHCSISLISRGPQHLSNIVVVGVAWSVDLITERFRFNNWLSQTGHNGHFGGVFWGLYDMSGPLSVCPILRYWDVGHQCSSSCLGEWVWNRSSTVWHDAMKENHHTVDTENRLRFFMDL